MSNKLINGVVNPICPNKEECLIWGMKDECLIPGEAIGLPSPCPHYDEIAESFFKETER